MSVSNNVLLAKFADHIFMYWLPNGSRFLAHYLYFPQVQVRSLLTADISTLSIPVVTQPSGSCFAEIQPTICSPLSGIVKSSEDILRLKSSLRT
jgi:hypothetical protein